MEMGVICDRKRAAAVKREGLQDGTETCYDVSFGNEH